MVDNKVGGADYTHCSSCQEAIKSFQVSLASPPPTKIVMAIDAKFRKQLQELHNRMSKVCMKCYNLYVVHIFLYYQLNERYKGLAVNDIGKLETSVAETHANLMKFCRGV